MSGTLCGVLIAGGLPLYYLSSCAFWPYSKCWRCKGDAKHKAMWGGGFRLCGWCSGTGRRLKVGRWVFNYIRAKKKASR